MRNHLGLLASVLFETVDNSDPPSCCRTAFLCSKMKEC